MARKKGKRSKQVVLRKQRIGTAKRTHLGTFACTPTVKLPPEFKKRKAGAHNTEREYKRKARSKRRGFDN